METTSVNIRLPDDLRKEFDEKIVPALRKELGVPSINRTDAIIKAMDEFAKKYR